MATYKGTPIRLTYKGIPISLAADFSEETLQARGNGMTYLK